MSNLHTVNYCQIIKYKLTFLQGLDGYLFIYFLFFFQFFTEFGKLVSEQAHETDTSNSVSLKFEL